MKTTGLTDSRGEEIPRNTRVTWTDSKGKGREGFVREYSESGMVFVEELYFTKGKAPKAKTRFVAVRASETTLHKEA